MNKHPTFDITPKLSTEEYLALRGLLRKAVEDDGFAEPVREIAEELLAAMVFTTHPAKV